MTDEIVEEGTMELDLTEAEATTELADETTALLDTLGLAHTLT